MTEGTSFVAKGARSYLDALGAIEAYERAVCEICRSVYVKRKPELVKIIGLADEACENHDENTEPKSGFAELGVCQNTASNNSTLYVYLRWDATTTAVPGISAEVALEFTRKRDRDEFAKLLRKIPSLQSSDESDYPILWSSKKLDDLSSCAEALDGLLREFVECWPAGRKLL